MKNIIVMSLILLGGSAYAQDSGPVELTNIDETFSDTVKVSGEFLKGVQLVVEETQDQSLSSFFGGASSRALYVFFAPDALASAEHLSLCVTLSSIDGRYRAHMSYRLNYNQKSKLQGFVKLPFESRHADELSGYADQEIAILVRIKESCDDRLEGKTLVASWNQLQEELFESANLILFIRSDARKDVASFQSNGQTLTSVRCKKIRDTYNVSYDKFCTVKGIQFDKKMRIEFERKNLQSIVPPKPVQLN